MPLPGRAADAQAHVSSGSIATKIDHSGHFRLSFNSGSTEDIAVGTVRANGPAADLVALVVPSCVARLWQARHRATSLAGWAVWVMTFVFAVTAGVGFASTNIADVTLARASRVTPAVAAAQAALNIGGKSTP